MLKRFLTFIFIFFFVASLSHAWLAGYGFRKKITIQGTNLDANVTHFPLLIYIVDADIDDECDDDGDRSFDIRFTQSDDSVLDVNWEDYSEAGGNATITAWVSDAGWTIESDGSTYIYLYYGNAAAGDPATDAGVWDANFEAVWHLEGLTDSSGNGKTLTAQAGAATDAGGKIRGCYLLDDASSQYLTIAEAIVTNEPITLEAWFKSDTIALDQVLIGIADVGTDLNWFDFYATGGAGGDPIRTRKRNNGGIVYSASSSGFAANTWHYATGTFASDVLRSSFIDGANKGINETDHADPTSLDNTCIGRIGDASPGNYMSGYIDEARISSSVRADAWIKFTFHNVDEGDNELTWAGEESAPSGDFIPKVIIIR